MVGDDGRVRVADFGLARAGRELDDEQAPVSAESSPLGLTLTATGAILGTPAYMSPEQHMGLRADARSDQFSFCVALWEALYGQRPFPGDTAVETSVAVIAGLVRPPPADSRVPRWIADVLRRGLARDPAHRYPDMPSLLAALSRDPARARRRWFAGAALFAMSSGTAFFIADYRAAEAAACSGAAEELAGVWDPQRRAEVSAALAAADPDVAARVLAGLDGYAARWAAGHRDACLDHRRGELSAALFDARVRCLDRRRLALGSAVRVLVAPEPATDPAQLVARLPALGVCDDPAAVLSDPTLPEDPALAASFKDLDALLIDARARFHGGDVRGALAAADVVVDEARQRDFRPLLAEALLLRGQIDEALYEFDRGRAAVNEAAAHALATRRDDLAAEALARRLCFDAHLGRGLEAFADAAIARALAERLPAPEGALARLDNNIGHTYFMLRDLDGARPYFERATRLGERAAALDPIEHANYWRNLAQVLREPDAREQAWARATTLLEGQLGDRHRLVLDLRMRHGEHAADPPTAVAVLAEVCPRLPELYPDDSALCAECFHDLGALHALRGDSALAVDAFARGDACLGRAPDRPELVERFATLRDRLATLVALERDRPDAALAHADAAIARSAPYQSFWWIAAEIAELELARARALLATNRPDEARAALTRAIPVFEDMSEKTVLVLPPLLRDEARALLARLPADAPAGQ